MKQSESVLTLAIPNWNGAKYLEETLRSFEANRPYVRWNLQDSCSTDDSVRIAERYLTARDRIVVEKDSGQVDGLNRAMNRMGGDIIGYINSDDCLTEDAASTVLRAFEDDPDLDLVYGEVEWIDGDGRLTGRHAGNISNLTELLDIYRIWWGGRQWVQPEVFYRRSLWERVGNFSSDYDLAFDFDYWVRCFLAGLKVRRIARPLARFRLHEAQKSKRAAEAAAEVRTIVAEALAEKPPIGAWERFRLQAWLGFDRYQAGQDHGDRVRPPLGRTLLRHPDWLIIPEVRQRFCRWALSCLRPAPVMGGGGK